MPVTVAFVAIAGMATFLIMLVLVHRQRMARIGAMGGGANVQRLEQIVAETSAQVVRLRERVQVLEKLVTDDDRRLADEIERLRRREPTDARG